jgi:hypothetical protein
VTTAIANKLSTLGAKSAPGETIGGTTVHFGIHDTHRMRYAGAACDKSPACAESFKCLNDCPATESPLTCGTRRSTVPSPGSQHRARLDRRQVSD